MLHALASIIARLNGGSQLCPECISTDRCNINPRLDNVRCSQFSLASMHGSSVDALLGAANTHKVLDGCRDVVLLQALDITICQFRSQVRVLRKRLLDLQSLGLATSYLAAPASFKGSSLTLPNRGSLAKSTTGAKSWLMPSARDSCPI